MWATFVITHRRDWLDLVIETWKNLSQALNGQNLAQLEKLERAAWQWSGLTLFFSGLRSLCCKAMKKKIGSWDILIPPEAQLCGIIRRGEWKNRRNRKAKKKRKKFLSAIPSRMFSAEFHLHLDEPRTFAMTSESSKLCSWPSQSLSRHQHTKPVYSTSRFCSFLRLFSPRWVFFSFSECSPRVLSRFWLEGWRHRARGPSSSSLLARLLIYWWIVSHWVRHPLASGLVLCNQRCAIDHQSRISESSLKSPRLRHFSTSITTPNR